MIDKAIDLINEADLQYLVDNSICEKKTLEYKLTLPGNSDGDKKEFLADVSSFANASGGDIIYGLREDRNTGYPTSLEGMEISNDDLEIRRLESIIRDGIRPRIPSSLIHIRVIPLQNSTKAIIIRTEKSWTSPHRVVFQGYDKFFARNQTGKYPLDVDELRTAFTLVENITNSIKRFREERISRIAADDTPIELETAERIIIHFLPLTSFAYPKLYNVALVDRTPNILKRIHTDNRDTHYGSSRYNVEGFLVYPNAYGSSRDFYVQFFRNGVIESVETSLVYGEFRGNKEIPIFYENYISDSVKYHLNILNDVGLSFPYFIFLSLIGFSEYTMQRNRRHPPELTSVIGTNVLMLPGCVIEDSSVDVGKSLKTAFDIIWNACGHPRSINYNENDEWTPQIQTNPYV